MPLQSAILYQNPAKTVVLLDIPRSISFAQGTPETPCLRQIYSTPPLETPFPSTEPKSEKAKARVAQHGMGVVEPFPADVLRAALVEVASHWNGAWCAERRVRPHQVQTGEKSASDERGETKKAKRVEESCLSEITSGEWHALDPLVLSNPQSDAVPLQSVAGRLVCNRSPQAVSLLLDVANQHYEIPPKSSFLWSRIEQSSTLAFSMAALSSLPDSTESAGPGEFDFILLDPPWPNRSARRSKAYAIEQDPMESLKPMLGQHIAPNGIVACWITNSSTPRLAALDTFEAWGVELVEEWAWLKVTSDGRPVTEIDGVWRKPYEVLLFGSKGTIEDEKIEISRRVIVAVPDGHSQKPHVKMMVESILGEIEGHRGLEIFARNLTAGWWAWGDEVLKFNWAGWWSDQSSHESMGITGS